MLKTIAIYFWHDLWIMQIRMCLISYVASQRTKSKFIDKLFLRESSSGSFVQYWKKKAKDINLIFLRVDVTAFTLLLYSFFSLYSLGRPIISVYFLLQTKRIGFMIFLYAFLFFTSTMCFFFLLYMCICVIWY